MCLPPKQILERIPLRLKYWTAQVNDDLLFSPTEDIAYISILRRDFSSIRALPFYRLKRFVTNDKFPLASFLQSMATTKTGRLGAHAQWPAVAEVRTGTARASCPDMAVRTARVQPMNLKHVTLTTVLVWLVDIVTRPFHAYIIFNEPVTIYTINPTFFLWRNFA